MFVSAVNHGFDPDRYLADFRLEAMGEIHLPGYAEDGDDAGLPLLIDVHNSPVRDGVWSLYAAAIRRLGATPGLSGVGCRHSSRPAVSYLSLRDRLPLPNSLSALAPDW